MNIDGEIITFLTILTCLLYLDSSWNSVRNKQLKNQTE